MKPQELICTSAPWHTPGTDAGVPFFGPVKNEIVTEAGFQEGCVILNEYKYCNSKKVGFNPECFEPLVSSTVLEKELESITEKGMKQREIKFRGIRVDNGEFVYGDLLHLEKDFKKYVAIIDWSTPLVKHEVKPETVGQYTGLPDKHGKEIYEGDTLKDHSGFKWVVFWHDEHACFGCKSDISTSEIIDNLNMEVIGNIYKHPHLLKQEKV